MQAVEEKKRLFVDFLVIEGRGLLASKDKRFVSVCLESRPDVRLFSRAVSASDYVWNCDGSFLSTAASDRLHVSLVSKKNEVLGKFTIGVRVTGGVVSQWFNLRDCVECACLEDAPLSRPDDPMPFGFSSAGRICVQYEISSRPESMFLAKYGMALRLLPFRIQGAEKAKFVHFLNFFFFFLLAGDLLFFSSKKLVTTGTKIATRSPWDHVAIAIMYKDYKKLYVLQSTISGVAVNEAEALLR
jgi:hypothetical protein